jgi:hypothetical protein
MSPAEMPGYGVDLPVVDGLKRPEEWTNPDAPQIEIARQAGVRRSTVWRIEGGSPRRRASRCEP